jgi:ribonuclease D
MTCPEESTPALITNPADLQHLTEALSHESILGVDTESNSLYAYQEQVCLIQFSTGQKDYLVDPLALEDLSPLASLFDEPGIEKVFHAAEYDLLCMKRDFGFGFSNLFDTMVAARILGRKEVGLGALLKEEFDIQQDKRNQRANWGERPLSTEMLNYACMDTHYLIPLRNRLREQLSQGELLPLAIEDFNRLSAIKINGNDSPENKTVDPWRISGSHDLDPQQAAILLELCRYRDKTARSLDRPLFKVINDSTLLAIATKKPQNPEELKLIPGMTAWQVKRHGHRLLQAVQHGSKARPAYPPRQPRSNNGLIKRLEALRDWRKKMAQKMGVASDVVLPRDLMSSVAARNPQTLEELAEALSETPWRLSHFGDQILEALHS